MRKTNILYIFCATAITTLLLSASNCSGQRPGELDEQESELSESFDLCSTYGEEVYEYQEYIGFNPLTSKKNNWIKELYNSLPTKEYYSDLTYRQISCDIKSVEVRDAQSEDVTSPYYVFVYESKDDDNAEISTLYTVYDCSGNKLGDFNNTTETEMEKIVYGYSIGTW